MRVPKVVEVFAIVWCIAGVVVEGMWVELGVSVGAPHVSGFGGLGEFGGDLLGLCGVDAVKLAFAGQWVGCVREWAYAI